MLTPPPGWPEFSEISAPVIFPWSAWSTEVAPGAWFTASPVTLAMVLPTWRRSTGAPVPVTTIPSSSTAPACRVTGATCTAVLVPSVTCRVVSERPSAEKASV
jgi:hypothetical protein